MYVHVEIITVHYTRFFIICFIVLNIIMFSYTHIIVQFFLCTAQVGYLSKCGKIIHSSSLWILWTESFQAIESE